MDLVERTHEFFVSHHLLYWRIAQGFFNCDLGETPELLFYARSHRNIAHYEYVRRICHYNLSYFFLQPREYETIIVREIAHAVCHSLIPKVSNHGELWQFVMSRVFCFPATHKLKLRRIQVSVEVINALNLHHARAKFEDCYCDERLSRQFPFQSSSIHNKNSQMARVQKEKSVR